MGKKKLWSCLTDDLDHCIECGREPAQLHHVFYGISANRRYSEEDGYIIPLCMRHHMDGPSAIHFSEYMNYKWRATAQRHFEETHTHEQFMKRYGKNYLYAGPVTPRKTGGRSCHTGASGREDI